ncbi:hypothetical protein H0H87_007052 [Tephrocybe sp. NHM501043]|nr:hypothetical protein H0H87_007052 [Tephrocybe sp. NHM501043]
MPWRANNTEDIQAVERHAAFRIGVFSTPTYTTGDWPKMMTDELPPSYLPRFTAAEKRDILGKFSSAPCLSGLSKFCALGSADFFAIDSYRTQWIAAPPDGMASCVHNTSHPLWPECHTTVLFDSNGGWAAGPSPDPLSDSWLQATPNFLRASLIELQKRWPTKKMYISEFGFVEPFEAQRTELFRITEDVTRTRTSSGFGSRLTQSALKRGDRVIATARSLEKLQHLVARIEPALRCHLRTLQLDVTDGEAVLRAKANEALAIWGQIDILVNNAGIGLPSLLEEGGAAHLRRQFATNVFGVIDLTAAVLPHLRASKQAAILVVGSRSAWKTEIPGIGPYSASKAAVHSLTETLATEVAPFNIRVLLIAPGSFRTEGIYGQLYNLSNRIAVNDPIREASMSKFKSIAGTEKGDPDKAMEAVVDIVRGEGVAAGRPWPGLLVLGEDAERDVRDKCNKVLKALDDWKDVTCGVNFDSVRL